MSIAVSIDIILQFWFGELDNHGYAAADRNKLWFQRSDTTDAAIREQFGALIEQALQGELEDWAETPRGRLALIILMDQFTRNIYRGTGKAFSGDAKALQLCKRGIELSHDQDLAPAEQVFFYLPLEHSENLADQSQCVALYTKLHRNTPEAYHVKTQSYIDYAVKHKEIIERFGRFPHRNKALGRESTPAELKYLENANTFGQ